MDIAKCTLDGSTYTAVNFALLPPNEMSEKRQNLVCTECEKDAFFRKASRTGQAACFGARPHESDCSFASAETQRVENEAGDEDRIRNPGQNIIIDLNYGAAPRVNVDVDPNDQGGNNEGRGRHVGNRPRPNANMQRRLSTLLRTLINSEEFRGSLQQITLGENEPTTVANFFVNFADVDAQHDYQFHGYWGLLADARLGNNGNLWLNSGGQGNISCLIQNDDVDAFYQRYNIDDIEDFAGTYILVLGEKNTSQNGKPYVVANGLERIVIQK
ncbi:hypothetical protein [Photobacterium kishitanii]|uniref:hypothetical protein n=1 Tax=Photobacterium kishitanii TaxID=318456 RepID=UPI000D154AED|nr:hypothetical protein [Photobacterium kishitanii]PSV14620.1 hypothetical protein C0W28_16635 [Photobacterium kishitanii]